MQVEIMRCNKRQLDGRVPKVRQNGDQEIVCEDFSLGDGGLNLNVAMSIRPDETTICTNRDCVFYNLWANGCKVDMGLS
jgi:hypothetical protein